VDGRIVGGLAAIATLIVLAFIALGLFTSLPGLLVAATFAAAMGAAIGALVDPRRAGHAAAVVAGFVVLLVLAYILIGRTTARFAAPGARGGPGVDLRR